MTIVAAKIRSPKRSRRSWVAMTVFVAVCLVLGAATTMGVSLSLQLWGQSLLKWMRAGSSTRMTSFVPGELVHRTMKGQVLVVIWHSPTYGQGTHSYNAIVASSMQAAHQLVPDPSSTDGSDIPAWVYREWKLMLDRREELIAGAQPSRPYEGFERSFFWITTYGWPFAATSAHQTMIDGAYSGLSVTSETIESWLRLDQPTQDRLRTTASALAIEPIWPGFALNSIFYAAIYALTTLGLFAFIRRRRMKRNHCVNCNYNLAGLAAGAPCPECGTLRRTRHATTPSVGVSPPEPANP